MRHGPFPTRVQSAYFGSMNDHEEERAIQIEFGVLAVLVAGAFIAGLVAAVRYLLA